MPATKRAKRSSSLTSSVYPSPSQSFGKEDVHLNGNNTNENEHVPPVSIGKRRPAHQTEEPVHSLDTSPADHSINTPNKRKVGLSGTVSGGGYNAVKSFGAQAYTGMAVGGSHVWNYEPGIWKETKEEPDLWKIDYKATKKRIKNAPKGSGAPEGMEYHWLIVAHQYARKIDANTYETHLVGSKYKLAHKPATSNSWSLSTVKAQRDREMELLEDAKQRVQGLPPVLAGEKVKVDKSEKGQQKLDGLFAKTIGGQGSNAVAGKKRKAEDKEND